MSVFKEIDLYLYFFAWLFELLYVWFCLTVRLEFCFICRKKNKVDIDCSKACCLWENNPSHFGDEKTIFEYKQNCIIFLRINSGFGSICLKKLCEHNKKLFQIPL